jgi:hypothetical protein
MAKPTKDKWLGARVEESLFKEVSEYIDAADMNMGELVRNAVKEYMWSHPKNPRPVAFVEHDPTVDVLIKPINPEEL